MADLETIRVYDGQVEAYVNLLADQPLDECLRRFIRRIKPKGHVLDLGCGPGLDAAVMRDNGLRVDAVDASLAMVQLANSKFDLNARQARFEELTANSEYDAVWASFSLLHASPQALPDILNAVFTALVAGGVFCLGMKLGAGTRRDKLGRFYAYYSQLELCEQLTTAGFAIEHTETGEAPGLAGETEPWIKIIARKG